MAFSLIVRNSVTSNNHQISNEKKKNTRTISYTLDHKLHAKPEKSGKSLATNCWVGMDFPQFSKLLSGEKTKIIGRYNAGAPLRPAQAAFINAVLSKLGQGDILLAGYKETEQPVAKAASDTQTKAVNNQTTSNEQDKGEKRLFTRHKVSVKIPSSSVGVSKGADKQSTGKKPVEQMPPQVATQKKGQKLAAKYFHSKKKSTLQPGESGYNVPEGFIKEVYIRESKLPKARQVPVWEQARAVQRYNAGATLYEHQADFLKFCLEKVGLPEVFNKKYAPITKESQIENVKKKLTWEKKRKKQMTVESFLTKAMSLKEFNKFFKKRKKRVWFKRGHFVKPASYVKRTRFKVSFVKNLVNGWRAIALSNRLVYSRSPFIEKSLYAVSRYKVLKLRKMALRRLVKRKRWFQRVSPVYNRYVGRFYTKPLRSIRHCVWFPIIRRKRNFWLKAVRKFHGLGSKQSIALKNPVRNNKYNKYKKFVGMYIASQTSREENKVFSMAKQPLFFKWKAAKRSFDFNKFFRRNKAVAKSINNFSLQLYSQYIHNLQDVVAQESLVEKVILKERYRAARLLRKYVALLKQYYNEVYRRKVAKNIPASSALHWVREYLRLTGRIKGRLSVWNRFNLVEFHFKPKAKKDKKRIKKKKILFKAKILFDRLFKWLYLQHNARYSLSTPIHNNFVSNYLVRNQFLLKKQFKVKLLGVKMQLEFGAAYCGRLCGDLCTLRTWIFCKDKKGCSSGNTFEDLKRL